MSGLRVLMTTDTVGGVWTYCLELAGALAAHDVEVCLAAMGKRPSREQLGAAAALDNVTLVNRDYALEWMDDPWDDVDAAGMWLLELEARLRPDLVHINGYAHAALGFASPVVCVAHSCVCSWWRAVHGQDAPSSWREYRRRVSAGLALADEVVAPTEAIRRAILGCYGRLPRGRVIANGIDQRPFEGDTGAEPMVLSAGRLWDEAKNLAALQACAERLPWPVYVAGGTEHPDGRDIRVRGVRPLGQLAPSALRAWMRRAAIYALPARYEPFGLSALEAALSGCALVLGDIDTLREVWDDAALFVAPDDPDALGAALAALAADPAARQSWARRARARARRYDSTRMAAGYHGLYRQLTRARRTAATMSRFPGAFA